MNQYERLTDLGCDIANLIEAAKRLLDDTLSNDTPQANALHGVLSAAHRLAHQVIHEADVLELQGQKAA